VIADQTKNFVIYESFFNEEEINAVLLNGDSKYDSNTIDAVSKIRAGELDRSYRSSTGSSIIKNTETLWLFEKLENAVVLANEDHFKLHVTGFEGGLEIIKYSQPNDRFDLHMDRGFGSPIRKLSVIVQLSPPDSYEGCDLELVTGKNAERMTKSLGSLIIFPSFILHRVTPLISGLRQSLVCWITGPPFS
jgi:PKHD-type hydroxylase